MIGCLKSGPRSRAVVAPTGRGNWIAVNEAQGPATARRGWPQ